MKALGLIETKGLVGAIVAADIALKTAQVELINREHTKGGLVCIEFEGDVAAVKASVEAAVTAIKDMGIYVGSHVIPRPDDSVEKIIKRKNETSKEVVIEEKEIQIENQKQKLQLANEEIEKIKIELKELKRGISDSIILFTPQSSNSFISLNSIIDLNPLLLVFIKNLLPSLINIPFSPLADPLDHFTPINIRSRYLLILFIL